MDEMIYNKHYITVDDRGCIIDGFSDAFRQPTDTDICINEQGGYQFRLFPSGKENPALCDRKHRIPLYKYENGEVVRRTEEEVEEDRLACMEEESAPSWNDQIEAQVTYTAMMTDTLLEG